MRLFHTTAAAEEILRDGFRDGHGNYGFVSLDVGGVFLARFPAGISDGAQGDQVLEVVLPDELDLTEWAIREDGHESWEWAIPAAVLNPLARVRELSQGEVDEARS